MADEHRDAVINTYRHLRVGMIVVVSLLAAAVVTQGVGAGCWQTSISAYYFTSAHSVFVAVLCALGAMLIVYQGSSDTEDSVLNFSGFLAFIVAFTPTTRPLICGGSGIPDAYDVSPGVWNNVLAVVVVAIAADATRLLLKYKANPEMPLSRWAKVSIVVGYLMTGLGVIVFATDRDLFVDHGHTVAAVTMFIGIIIVILINAWSARARVGAERFVRWYYAVAAFMAVALLTIVVTRFIDRGWRHLVMWLEVAVLVAFAGFWAVQTAELWRVVDRRELLPEGADPTGK
ncbi:MAG: hypothetical protein ABIM89_17675 [Mycobacteriales bacterium]